MLREDHKKFDGISGIYLITNILTGDSYVGASCNVGLRMLQHLRYKQLKIQQLLSSRDLSEFTFEVLEEVPREKLPERENYWITKLNPSLNQDRDSRSRPGFTYKHTEEAKIKMSKAKEGWKGNESTWKKGHEPWNKGKECPWRGRPRSEETRRKISEGHRKALENPEYRKKSSEAQKNRPKYRWLLPDGTTKILCIQHASRFYIRKGIQIQNLGICES